MSGPLMMQPFPFRSGLCRNQLHDFLHNPQQLLLYELTSGLVSLNAYATAPMRRQVADATSYSWRLRF